VRASRATVEVLRTLAAGNVGGITFTAPIRNLGFEDQQDKLDWVEGSGTLNIVSGATNGVSGPHGGSWYGRVQASTTAARQIHKELDLTAWVTGDQIDHDRVAVELSGYLASSSSLVLAQLELSFWDSQPQVAGAIQVGSDHLSPTVNTTGWVSRTTGVIDVPAGARWLRIGWGCPVSTIVRATQLSHGQRRPRDPALPREPGRRGVRAPCPGLAALCRKRPRLPGGADGAARHPGLPGERPLAAGRADPARRPRGHVPATPAGLGLMGPVARRQSAG
jgi:hypothetical protein